MDVILILNGLVENVIVADDVARAQSFYPAYTCVERAAGSAVGPGYTTTDNVTFTAPPPVVPPPVWKITRYAMLARFTPQEAIALKVAAQGTGVTPATVAYYLDALNAANYVDLQDPATISMIDALVSAALLTQARATAILTTPAAANEMLGGV